MSTPYYRPKRRPDLVRHLIEHHIRDHVVSGLNGARFAREDELQRLYAPGGFYTVERMTQRHDEMHAEAAL